MANLKTIALAQYPLTFHTNWNEFAAHIERWIKDARSLATGKMADILVFPEYGSLELLSTVPGAADLSLAEQMTALQPVLVKFDELMSAMAKKHQVILVAPSVPVRRNEFLVNEAWIYSRSGKKHAQGKYHMTRFESESWSVVASSPELLVFEDAGFNFGVQICFDIEFATASARLARHGAHAIFAPSCTETLAGLHRVHIGAQARALENQLYVGVAQTIGTAPWCEAVDVNRGQAAMYAPPDRGFPETGVVARGNVDAPEWLVHTIDADLVDAVRREGAVFNHQNNQIDFQDVSWMPVTVVRL